MAIVRIKIYKNSIMATICSVFGQVMAICGVITVFTEDVFEGIWLVVIGIAVMLLAFIISENKKFKVWKKEIEKNGYISVIQNSTQGAIQIYNMYPCKKALEYIRTLNTQAAEIIEQELHAKKK